MAVWDRKCYSCEKCFFSNIFRTLCTRIVTRVASKTSDNFQYMNNIAVAFFSKSHNFSVVLGSFQATTSFNFYIRKSWCFRCRTFYLKKEIFIRHSWVKNIFKINNTTKDSIATLPDETVCCCGLCPSVSGTEKEWCFKIVTKFWQLLQAKKLIFFCECIETSTKNVMWRIFCDLYLSSVGSLNVPCVYTCRVQGGEGGGAT